MYIFIVFYCTFLILLYTIILISEPVLIVAEIKCYTPTTCCLCRDSRYKNGAQRKCTTTLLECSSTPQRFHRVCNEYSETSDFHWLSSTTLMWKFRKYPNKRFCDTDQWVTWIFFVYFVHMWLAKAFVRRCTRSVDCQRWKQ